MGRTLSHEFHSRVVAAVEAGLSRRPAADRFGIGVANAIHWVRAFRATGGTHARPKGGDYCSHWIEACCALILGAVATQVDITLVELTEMLRASAVCTWRPARCDFSTATA